MDPEIRTAYTAAREVYSRAGADTDAALARLAVVSLALPCWQGDDVGGFERTAAPTGVAQGGIRATGEFPGKARTPEELRADLEKALSLLPGRHRVNLHAMYGEFGGEAVDRDAVEPRHFEGWIAWAAGLKIGLDFNATLFAHPRAADGLTLSHPDAGVRRFWVDHVRRCRAVAARFGEELGTPCIHNVWIPDGSKDLTVSRAERRQALVASLDEAFASRFDPAHVKDAVESKLFGIGSEAFVVGSHELYLGYALTRGLIPCLDLGHFHPTESVADKISAILQFSPELLLHVSRGVRWDSDHVPILDDGLRDVASEIVRMDALSRVHLALDFFDASINRVGAWVIAARVLLKALLAALLEPLGILRHHEQSGNGFARLALLEEAKTLPLGAVWDYHCAAHGVPPRHAWIDDVLAYERDVLRRRA